MHMPQMSETIVLADPGGAIQVPFVLTPGLIIGVLITVVVLLGVLITAGWLIWRRIRRSHLVERGLLQARAVTLPAGPQRDIAEMRLALNDNLTQTARVLGTLRADLAGSQLLTDLLRRLRQTATALDTHLRLLSTEPDQRFLAAMLPSLRQRTGTIQRDTLRLRQTGLRLLSEEDLLRRSLLEQDLRDSVEGLEAGLAEVRALGHPA
jgi:hypothetical protein